MGKITNWMRQHVSGIIATVIASLIVAALIGAYQAGAYIVTGVYEAPNREKLIRDEFTNSMGKLQESLSNKLDEHGRLLKASEENVKGIKQTLVSLIFVSPLSNEEKIRMTKQLVAALDPIVIAATAEAAKGNYSIAYRSLFDLDRKGNSDARIVLFSLSDALYAKISTGDATRKEQQAFKNAIAQANSSGPLELVQRYKKDEKLENIFKGKPNPKLEGGS